MDYARSVFRRPYGPMGGYDPYAEDDADIDQEDDEAIESGGNIPPPELPLRPSRPSGTSYQDAVARTSKPIGGVDPQPSAPPYNPALTDPGMARRPTPSLDSLREHTGKMPQMPDPRKAPWWAKVAAIGAGTMEGLVNSGGRVRVDSSGLQQELLHPGYSTAMKQWQIKDDQLRRAADLEARQDRVDQEREVASARKRAYEAQYARAVRPAAPVAKAPIRPVASDPEEVERRRQYAESKGMTQETNPGLQSWILTGTWHEPRPTPQPTAPRVSGPYAFLPENEREDTARREINAKINRLEREPANGGGGGEKGRMTEGQRKTQALRIDDRMKKDYAKAEADYKVSLEALESELGSWRQQTDPNLRKIKEEVYKQKRQQIDDEHMAAKQAIEDDYKDKLEILTGQPQPRVQYSRSGQGQQAQGKTAAPTSAPAQSNPAPAGQSTGKPKRKASRQMIAEFARKNNLSIVQARQSAINDGFEVED